MGLFFNTEGPIIPQDHYHIDPLKRVNLDEILLSFEQKKYFVLHAPRQTGKTTLVKALMDYLNKQGHYKSLHVNIEAAQAARGNVKAGIRTVLERLTEDALDYINDSFFSDKWDEIFDKASEFTVLQKALKLWAKHNEKPIVLFIDEVDSLVGDTLISLLRQLRSGYDRRPRQFPQSIVLCGVRDVRDYRIHSAMEKEIITGGSAFNIKSESLRLGNFTPHEIKTLYEQHTKETGQTFHQDVFPLVWEQTEGQPWLVNALAQEICFRMKAARNAKKKLLKT